MEYLETDKAHAAILREKKYIRALLTRLYCAAEEVILRWGTVLLFLVAWELAVYTGLIPHLFVSSPTRIFKAAVEVAKEGTIWSDMMISGEELFLGFFLSVVFGVPLGMLLGWYRRVRVMGSLFVAFFYAMPRVALLPLLILWLGIGMYSKVALVFLGAFFSVLISTVSGIQNLDETLVKCSRSFGANDWQLFRTVAFPSSLPFILVGCRLGVSRALIGVVVGELYGATAGVGFFIANAGSLYQTDRVFVGIIIISVVGVLLLEGIDRIESRLQRWRPETQHVM